MNRLDAPVSRATESALKCFTARAVADNTDEARIINWLEESLDNIRFENDTLKGPDLLWNQGACQVLQELLDVLK